MQIKVHNWKQLVRTDLKRPSWFAFEADFYGEPRFMGRWTPHVNQAFCYIVSQAIRSEGLVEIVPQHMTGFTCLSASEFEAAVKILEDLKLLTVVRTDPVGTRSGDGLHITLQDKTLPNTSSADSEPTLPLLEPVTPNAAQERTYDPDHETVVTKPKATELPRLAQLWNEKRHPDLGAVILANGTRRRAAVARMKEHPSEQFWIDAIKRVSESDFCLGKVTPKDGGRPWKANFDWFVRPDTIAKILEGQYDNRRAGPGSSPSTLSYWARQQAAQKEPQQ